MNIPTLGLHSCSSWLPSQHLAIRYMSRILTGRSRNRCCEEHFIRFSHDMERYSSLLCGWHAYLHRHHLIVGSFHSTTTTTIICHLQQVLEIITLRRDGLRGQAWVIYEEVQAATAALQAENGFTFFGKDLQLAYAHETSDRIAKRNGTYVPKAKRKKVERTIAVDPLDGTTLTTATEPTDDMDDPPGLPKDTAEPSHILFAQDLPSECNEMMLAMLFRQYAGFQEVRIPRQGLGFIEFDDEPHATLALERLNGFKLTTKDTLKLTYGKS